MFIKKILLQNFRNFSQKEFEFEKLTTIIIGPNASGKTNTLEAIYLLATGKSFHARHEEEMVKDGQDLARARGTVESNDEKINLEVLLTRGLLNGAKVARKKLSVNGVSRHLYNFVGNLRVVLFGPWDMNLITGSPSTRRRFLDDVVSQVDREYRRALLSYEKGLRQRNKVLERIREGLATRSQLLFWDKLLIKNGDYISKKKEEFINFVNATEKFQGEEFKLEYDKSSISEARLEQYSVEEVSAAATLVGPHRDDLVFLIKKEGFSDFKNLSVYGSRGEQRMGILWVKLATLSYITETTGQRPVLLLDDIFSELDYKHYKLVMDVVGKQQTIITTANLHTVEDWKEEAHLIEL